MKAKRKRDQATWAVFPNLYDEAVPNNGPFREIKTTENTHDAHWSFVVVLNGFPIEKFYLKRPLMHPFGGKKH